MSSVYTYPGTGTSFAGGAITSPITGANGSAAAPTYSFTAASNYGWYFDSVNSALAASVNGVETTQLRSTDLRSTVPFLSANGAVGAPAFSFTASPSTGMYSSAANQLDFSANGVRGINVQKDAGFPTYANVGINMAGQSGATLSLRADDSNGVDLIGGYRANGTTPFFRLAYNGRMIVYGQTTLNFASTATTPGLLTYFAGSGGIYSDAQDVVGIATAGVRAFYVDANQKTSAIKWLTANKTANYTVLTTDTSMLFDNTGAGGTTVTFTLPTAATGLTYTFCDVLTTALSGIVITPQGGDTIAYSTKTAGQSITSPVAARGSVTLTCTAANTWAVTSMIGTFT